MTVKPYLITKINNTTTNTSDNRAFKPHEYKGNLYVVVFRPGTTNFLEVWKSVNDGVSWSNVLQITVTANSTYRLYWDTVSREQYLYILYNNTSTFLEITRFNMATDSIDANFPSNFPLTFVNTLLLRSDLSFVVSERNTPSTSTGIRYWTITPSGIWSGATVIAMGIAQGTFLGSCIGASDRVHFFYLDTGPNYNVWHGSIDAANAADTPAQLGVQSSGGHARPPVAFRNGDSIYVLIVFRKTPPQSAHALSVANPAWTLLTPPTGPDLYRQAVSVSDMAVGLTLTADFKGLHRADFRSLAWSAATWPIYQGTWSVDCPAAQRIVSANSLSLAVHRLGIVIREVHLGSPSTTEYYFLREECEADFGNSAY